MTESLLMDSGFVVPVFSLGDDPIACLNKAMAFLTIVASSGFPSTNNQLRTFSNLRTKPLFKMAESQCNKFRGDKGKVILILEKVMLAEAQKAGQILDEEQLAFLVDLGVPDGQAVQKIIPNIAAFQTEDFDTYDSDCDDISHAKAILMANISNYGSDVISEQFEKLVNASRAKKLEKYHDPLALVAYTGSTFRNTSSYYVTHPMSVVDYNDEYQQDDVQTNSEDPLAFAMLRAYVQEEVVKGSNAQNETGNVQRTLRTSSLGNISTVQCYNCSGKGHYARNCPKPRVWDSKMEEFEELSANICLMARIQPVNNTFDVGPSYDSAFISEVKSSSIKDTQEQMYPTHTKIINNTIGDDQINSNIIFDEPNGNVNSGSVGKDTHVPDLYALEQLAINAYKEAEKQQLFAQKVQQRNTTLTSQLELYKERVRVSENIKGDNNYLNEFIEADGQAKHFNQQAQSQFV
ncbi:retrovirus-related pol polyprotein from transposon TNT 1-94 [Tanacetum coccineum]